MDINPCPNIECGNAKAKHPALLYGPNPTFCVGCPLCGYRGPNALTSRQAIRLHNLISRPSQEPAPVQPPVKGIFRIPAYTSPSAQPSDEGAREIQDWLKDAEHRHSCGTIPTTWKPTGEPVYLINHPGMDERMSLHPECTCGLDSIRKHSAVSPKAGACEWSPQNDWENDSDDRWWNTGCGHEFVLNAGNVPGREFSYCPYCGGEASPAVSVGDNPVRSSKVNSANVRCNQCTRSMVGCVPDRTCDEAGYACGFYGLTAFVPPPSPSLGVDAQPSVAAEALKSFVNISPIVMEGFPDAHKVTFDVDSQHFDIAPDGCETKEDAEWMRDMFLRALSKVAHPGIAPGWVPPEWLNKLPRFTWHGVMAHPLVEEQWIRADAVDALIQEAAAPKGQP